MTFKKRIMLRWILGFVVGVVTLGLWMLGSLAYLTATLLRELSMHVITAEGIRNTFILVVVLSFFMGSIIAMFFKKTLDTMFAGMGSVELIAVKARLEANIEHVIADEETEREKIQQRWDIRKEKQKTKILVEKANVEEELRAKKEKNQLRLAKKYGKNQKV